MNNYQILLNILDKIRFEAPSKYEARYRPASEDFNRINQIRSRAFIHLYLKVAFGLLDFDERENFVTDGNYDGGVDGYFIDKETKTIFLIQAKFRTNERNFEEKEISLTELLKMDITRILDGESTDENGNSYNGKIKQLQREISELENIARYSYQVIILANLSKITNSQLLRLTGGIGAIVFDFSKCYRELVFPVLTGTYFTASDVNIRIDLSSKDSGNRIGYRVTTKHGDCEITVLFVPTIEIGRIMNRYKNSILKFNPRSYLGFSGQNVNQAIRDTIRNEITNEFALFNNGITMLSDETFFNEKIGQKGKAQLTVTNPQIINGGQTSYTLAKLYEEAVKEASESVFDDKEVLLKIITLLDKKDTEEKASLIEEVSTATNRQTPVSAADRLCNDKYQIRLQDRLFDDFGILLERKKGEFYDGVNSQYLREDQILERNEFYRIYFAANDMVGLIQGKRLYVKHSLDAKILDDSSKLERFYFTFLVSQRIQREKSSGGRKKARKYFAQLAAACILLMPSDRSLYESALERVVLIRKNWEQILDFVEGNPRYQYEHLNKLTGETTLKKYFDMDRWYVSPEFLGDVKAYYDKYGLT